MAHHLAANIVRWNRACTVPFFVKSQSSVLNLESEICYGTFLFVRAAVFIADDVVVTIILPKVILAWFVILWALPLSVYFLGSYHLKERLLATLAAD